MEAVCVLLSWWLTARAPPGPLSELRRRGPAPRGVQLQLSEGLGALGARSHEHFWQRC